MNDGKVISQILTVAIWSAGSIGLPFNLLCFFNLLGARIFKAKLNVVSRWARSDGCISWPCLVERLLMVLWCLAWVAVDELLTLQGSIFCTNTRVSMPFIPTGPKTWRDLWIERCLSPRVTRSLSWSFFPSNIGCVPPRLVFVQNSCELAWFQRALHSFLENRKYGRGREWISSNVSYVNVRQGISTEPVIQALQPSVEYHRWRWL